MNIMCTYNQNSTKIFSQTKPTHPFKSKITTQGSLYLQLYLLKKEVGTLVQSITMTIAYLLLALSIVSISSHPRINEHSHQNNENESACLALKSFKQSLKSVMARDDDPLWKDSEAKSKHHLKMKETFSSAQSERLGL